MSFVYENTDFRGRLLALLARDGYTGRGWSERAAKDMYDMELLDLKNEYKGKDAYEDGDAAIARLINRAATRLRDHVIEVKDGSKKHSKYKSAAQISGDWLDRYCRFFDCSSAFLFGEIDDPRFQDTDIQAETGLELSAIKTLKEYQIAGLFEGGKNPTAATVSFLLRKDHCKRNSGGLLHLIAAYLTPDDFSAKDMDSKMEYIHNDGQNGSGFELNTADVIRAAIPNMILQRLNEYREEIQHARKK